MLFVPENDSKDFIAAKPIFVLLWSLSRRPSVNICEHVHIFGRVVSKCHNSIIITNTIGSLFFLQFQVESIKNSMCLIFWSSNSKAKSKKVQLINQFLTTIPSINIKSNTTMMLHRNEFNKFLYYLHFSPALIYVIDKPKTVIRF